MPNGSKFSRLTDPAEKTLSFRFEGETLTAWEGDTVAAALLAAGYGATRDTTVSGVRRGAFCMMGVCFDCLVEIDGEPNRQSCQVLVREGMAVRRMSGARDAGPKEVP